MDDGMAPAVADHGSRYSTFQWDNVKCYTPVLSGTG